jgi:hypothetical protein
MLPTDPISVPPVVAEPVPPQQLAYETPREFQIPANWTNAEIFTLDPARLSFYTLLAVSLRAIIGLATGAAALILFAFVLRDLPLRLRIISLCIYFAIIVGMMLLRAVLTALKIRRSWPIYRLVVADQGFFLHILSLPDMTVSASEIRSIVEEWAAFRVVTTSGRRIHISKQTIEPARLRDRLAALCPISARKGLLQFTLATGFGLTMALFHLGACFAAYVLTANPWIIALLMLICAIFAVISIRTVWRTALYRWTTKLLTLSVLLLFPILLLGRLIFVLILRP